MGRASVSHVAQLLCGKRTSNFPVAYVLVVTMEKHLPLLKEEGHFLFCDFLPFALLIF